MIPWLGLEHYRGLPAPLAFGVSGGRSSAMQMAHYVEANGGVPPGTIFNFENTGLEDAATYYFLDKLDQYYGLDLHWLEYDPDAPGKVKRVTYATAAREGEPFERYLSEVLPKRRDGTAGVRPLPNPVQRTCTSTLKVKTLHRYVRQHLGWPTAYYSAIGYRADEPERYERRLIQDAKGWPEGGKMVAPMYHSGATADDTLAFWAAMPFDLDLDGIFGNCDLCFMAAAWKITERMLRIAEQDQIKPVYGGPIPARIMRWIAWEERQSDRPGVFRKDRPGYRALWDAVCMGDLFSLGNGDLGLECGRCTD